MVYQLKINLYIYISLLYGILYILYEYIYRLPSYFIVSDLVKIAKLIEYLYNRGIGHETNPVANRIPISQDFLQATRFGHPISPCRPP